MQYPGDWYTARGEVACRFFDPEPFTVPANSDFGGTAMQADVVQQSFDDALAGLIDRRFYETEAREQVTIGGKRAFRLELVATGQGLEERGTRTYGYLIRRAGGPPIYLQTTARRGEDLVHADVVDHAAQTLATFVAIDDPAEVSEPGLPDAVRAKRDEILRAAESGDADAVAALADPAGFEYTFGGPVPGGPAAYWRQIEEEEQPLEALTQILRMPYTLSRGMYVWPFAYDKTEDELTDYERELLAPLGEGGAFADGYLGWRAGITPDGRWQFFVAGD